MIFHEDVPIGEPYIGTIDRVANEEAFGVSGTTSSTKFSDSSRTSRLPSRRQQLMGQLPSCSPTSSVPLRSWNNSANHDGSMFDWHAALVQQQTSMFGGAVVKNQGDGFMLAFPAMGSAAACAIGLQRAIS